MADQLESERLYYKPLSLTHLSDRYVSWLNNPTVYKYLETGGDQTIDTLKQYLTDVEKKEMLFWGIHLKSSEEHIGNIKIDPINRRHGLGEYGILMGDERQWGKGYAKEASIRIINYCFEIQKLRKITLGVVSKNEAAVKLYNSLQFQIEGVYKRHGLYDGEYLDVLRMALFSPNISQP
jgi:[ribosomal protein S5]-alanine N-acetyltransferase